jgi:iron complex outermembrane receptor protein
MNKERILPNRGILLLIGICLVLFVDGQEKADTGTRLIHLKEFVITATRTDKPVIDIPMRVNVLNAGLLYQIPVKSLDDALQMVPGINISRPFGVLSSKATVTMRGMNGKEQARVLVLVDGLPVNKSDGGTVDWNMIDLSFVEKIELTKGAGSSLYGGNAMGGVINIITRTPSEGLKGQASLEYGTFNTYGAKVNLGDKHVFGSNGRAFYWMANTFYRQSEGYITQSEADQLANPYIVKSNMAEYGLAFKSGVQFNRKHSLEVKINLYNDRRGTGEKVYQPEGNTTDHDSYSINLNYREKMQKAEIRSMAYLFEEDYKKVNEYLKDDYTWYDVLSVRRDLGWISYLSANLPGKNQLTAGYEMKLGSVDAYDQYYTSSDVVYNEGKMLTYALFMQDEARLWKDKITLIAGIRFDQSKFFDGSFRIEKPTRETDFMFSRQVPVMTEKSWSAISPRLSLQYKFNPSDRVYVLYSRGFRTSVLDDLCRSGRIKGGFKLANPGIKPEFLNNIEAGMDYLLMKKLQFAASAYYSMGKDFQYYVSNGQTIDMGFGDRPVFIRANISSVEITGVEAELKYNLDDKLSVFGNYGFNHSVITDYQKIAGNDTIDLSGKYITDVPEHVFSLGGTWINSIVNSSLTIRYTGSMWVNDQNIMDEILLDDQYSAFTTADLRIWKEIRKHYLASLTVQNLFDVKYYDSKEAVCPGRFITWTITYKF